MKGLYIHIPFCNSICSYCDFPKRVSNQINKKNYINSLIKEINEKKELLHNINTVYIGGGTPNSIELNDLKELFESIKDILKNGIENSIELNPELITKDLLLLLKEYNFNRLSLGVQSFNPRLIKVLNRNHDKKLIIEKLNLIKEIGFNNINIDLMFGIPTEDLNDLKEDLNIALSLDITHISYYSLILEDKTILKHKIDNNIYQEVDDDLEADMYDYINKTLKENGFNHYEISNYAKKGFESKHNLIYWTMDEYIGVGMSAASFYNNTRFQNTLIFKEYIENNTFYKEELDKDELMNEYMMLGLRKTSGISISDFVNKYNISPLIYFKDKINHLIKINMIDIENDIIKIKEDKLFLANIAFEEFVK